MKAIFRTILILMLFTASVTIFCQESEKPNWLVLSQNMVKMSEVGKINKMIDSISAPILNKLCDEGMLSGWGQFNHAWGDEWNVNFWYVTKDQESFGKFWTEFVKRVQDQHPGSFSSIVKHFQAHKDNMYVIRNQYSATPNSGN